MVCVRNICINTLHTGDEDDGDDDDDDDDDDIIIIIINNVTRRNQCACRPGDKILIDAAKYLRTLKYGTCFVPTFRGLEF